MINESHEILKILKEAEENHKNIISLCAKNTEIAKLYLGSQVLFSPIIDNPEIMLLGINPGPGYFNQTDGERVAHFMPLHKLEYLTHDYILAVETRAAFKRSWFN